MKIVDRIALVLVIIGALNWGGWDGEHINTEKDRLSAVFFCVYRLVIIMDKTCCGAAQVENGFPFWAAAAEKTRPCQSMVPYCFILCCTFSFGLQPLCR